MAFAMRLTVAALVLCAAFVTPALAGRQLKQSSGTIDFPGCTFLSDSQLAINEDYSILYAALQATGLTETLSSLSGPATLFAPTNNAFADFLATFNLTAEEALTSPSTSLVLQAHVVSGAILSEGDFVDGEVLPTVLEGSNITTLIDEVNNTETVTVVSFASEATIVTPATYACNLVIYGIDGVLVPEVAVFPFESDALVEYLTGTLKPGSAEVPLSLIVAAVQANELGALSEAFLTTTNSGNFQPLNALYDQAAGSPGAMEALAAVGNEVIQDSSCATYTPFLQQLPVTAQDTAPLFAESYPLYSDCFSSINA